MDVCANCEWNIDGNAVFVTEIPFCCTGCADGGPCNCAYELRIGRAAGGDDAVAPSGAERPSGWSLMSRDRANRATHDDDSVLPAPRRARLGTDG